MARARARILETPMQLAGATLRSADVAARLLAALAPFAVALLHLAEGFVRDAWQARHELLKLRSRDARLADDGGQRAESKLLVIGHGNSHSARTITPLHGDMAATLPHGFKSIPLQNLTDLAAGKKPQLTQSRPPTASHTPRNEDDCEPLQGRPP